MHRKTGWLYRCCVTSREDHLVNRLRKANRGNRVAIQCCVTSRQDRPANRLRKANRGNFVYTITFARISNIVCDKATTKYIFWILKGNSTINCAKRSWARCIEYFLCDAGLTTYTLQRMYNSLALDTQKYIMALNRVSSNITLKGPNTALIIKFHKLFKCVHLNCV